MQKWINKVHSKQVLRTWRDDLCKWNGLCEKLLCRSEQVRFVLVKDLSVAPICFWSTCQGRSWTGFINMRDIASVKEVIGQIRRAECTLGPGAIRTWGEELHGLENGASTRYLYRDNGLIDKWWCDFRNWSDLIRIFPSKINTDLVLVYCSFCDSFSQMTTCHSVCLPFVTPMTVEIGLTWPCVSGIKLR